MKTTKGRKIKIPIDIHVRSERMLADVIHRGERGERAETDDFKVSGTMKKQKGGYHIEFTEEDGGIITTIDTYPDEMVMINRVGPLNSHMVFADGKAHTCICNTGMFPLQMRVRTKSLKNTLSMEGGKLDIDFTVEILGNLAERNRLSFSVSPDISIIRS